MNNKIDWAFKLMRIAGVNFPGSAAFGQIQAEFASEELMKRITKLEDPISYLHADIPEVSREIYKELVSKDDSNLNFDDAIYLKYSRALAVLDSKGLISKKGVLGSTMPIGFRVTDPTYIIYMCVICEDSIKMQRLYDIVDDCKNGDWLIGKT